MLKNWMPQNGTPYCGLQGDKGRKRAEALFFVGNGRQNWKKFCILKKRISVLEMEQEKKTRRSWKMRKNRLFGRMAGLTSAALAAMAAAAPVMAAVSGSVPGGG